jgi:5-methyltetrahydropteroyltriglutamate--homocysteine methyltransferase
MIQTTVVGSYRVPGWLRIYNSRESLRDAMLVELKTQELAGIDVVADGELYRWDINHPETEGMVDYFVYPDCGLWKLPRNVADAKLRAVVSGRDLVGHGGAA